MSAADDAAVLHRVNARQAELEAIGQCLRCDSAGWRYGRDELKRCEHNTATTTPEGKTQMTASIEVEKVDTPPKWRVECPKPSSGDVIPLSACMNPFAVRSPRGIETFRAPTHAAAVEIACRMAAIDELLKFVATIAPAPEPTCTCHRYHPSVWGQMGFCDRHGAIAVPIAALDGRR